jgi:hypothetical protein
VYEERDGNMSKEVEGLVGWKGHMIPLDIYLKMMNAGTKVET